MCELVSLIEVDGVLYYLTQKELNSSRGLELKAHLGSKYYQDVIGHGAIDWYFDLEGKGKHKECTDFSSPSNFPKEIAEAIKAGAFSIGVNEGLLTPEAYAEYDKVVKSARAECDKVVKAAYAEYDKVVEAANAERDKVVNREFWELFAKVKNRNEAWR